MKEIKEGKYKYDNIINNDLEAIRLRMEFYDKVEAKKLEVIRYKKSA